eukprot:4208979-Amphidinium_carterae.1
MFAIFDIIVKGEYNFSYLKRQDCRKLKKKKVNVRPAGFFSLEVRPLMLAPSAGRLQFFYHRSRAVPVLCAGPRQAVPAG